MESLGQRLKERRIEKGYSQEELAERAGVSIRTIQRIEKGENEPRGATLQLLCLGLDLDIAEVNSVSRSQVDSIDKVLYLSVCIGVLVPLGNVVAPLIVWQGNKKRRTSAIGRHIVLNQTLYSLLSSFLIGIWILGKINRIENINYVFWGVLLASLVNYGVGVCAFYKISKGEKKSFYYPLFKKTN